MNPPSRPSPLPRGSTLAWLALAGSSFFSATVIGSAQSAPPSAPGDTIVELNPFEVSSDRDHGYQAITTLAGGRIQSDLKDTPATISILTKEFMEDLGLDNNVDFSVWAPNSEIPYTENGFLDEYRTSSRALSPSFGSRNYFRSYTSGDSYNTERLEFARGPNALLFGDASIGGISTVWTKQARLARRIASLQTRVDSYGSYRANIDYNWSPNKAFAVRTNALYAKTESWRDVESATTKAIHVASTFALGPQTQIRVEGEYSDRKLSVPFGVILDQASNYLRLTPEQREAAKWTGTKTTGFPTGTTRYSTDRIVWIESSPDLGALNWINRGLSTGTGLSLVPEGRTALPGFPGLPSREFNANAPSAVLTYETTTASVYLDQKIGNDLFIQVAYNYSLPKNQRDEIRWNDLFIDVNEFLPSPGTPAVNGPRNPYYGVPYADEEARRLDTRNELHEGRVMAAWKFQTSWTDQAFSLLLSQRRDDYLAARSRQVPRGLKTGTAYYSSNSTAEILYHRRYWNSLDRGDYSLPPSYVSPNGQTLPIEWRPYEDSRQETTLTSLQLANVGKFLRGRLSVVGGYRYDKYDRTDSTLVSRFGSDSPNNGAPNEVILDPEKRQISRAHSPSIGVVYWLFKGIGLSANYAESFNIPSFGNTDIYNRPFGPSNAKGIEAGLRFDLFDSRLTGSLLYYENESEGGATSTGLDAANVFNRINAIWTAVDPNQSVSTSRDVQSTSGHGYEAELVYNPTRAWRMRLAAGVPYAETTDKWLYLKQYIGENRGRWEANGSLPTTRAGTESTVQGTLNALQLYLLNNAEDGLRNTGGYKWNANIFTSYRFLNGSLRNLTLGGGARYTSERFVGRTSMVNAAGQNEYTEWWNEDLILLNAMAKYEFKVRRKPISIQVNVENLLDNDQIDFRGVTTVGGTTYYQGFAWIPPIKVVASASLQF